MKAANDLSFEDITIGDVYEFEREITEKDVQGFAKLTGDYNPLHLDKEYAEKTNLGRNIVHGMLAGSLFSTLLGMYCPGKRNLYMSQTLQFRNPIFFNEKLLIKGTITEKSDSTKMISIKTEIRDREKLLITGEAKVRVI
jgi:acyl dehydratase